MNYISKMPNTNKNGPSKFKTATVTRISIMFVLHKVISKILVNILFVPFTSVMAINQQPLKSTGICFSNPNDSSFMIPTAI